MTVKKSNNSVELTTGEKLKERLKEAHMTQAGWADQCGIDRVRLHRWLTGETTTIPSKEELSRLARAMRAAKVIGADLSNEIVNK